MNKLNEEKNNVDIITCENVTFTMKALHKKHYT